VVKKPLAKFRVPVNSIVKSAAPRSVTAPFGEGSVPPMPIRLPPGERRLQR
jgi:hypothetical protein